MMASNRDNVKLATLGLASINVVVGESMGVLQYTESDTGHLRPTTQRYYSAHDEMVTPVLEELLRTALHKLGDGPLPPRLRARRRHLRGALAGLEKANRLLYPGDQETPEHARMKTS